jgi:hypothetical protein
MNSGMKYLKEKLGVIEAEIFISTLKEDDFDYTDADKFPSFGGVPP